MLTPIEIQGKTFKSGRGYKKEEIDEFLITVGRDYAALYKENLELKDKVSSLNEGIQYYKSIENTLQKALVLAEKTSNDTTSNATRKAEAIEAEARIKAENIEAEARAEAENILAESKTELSKLEIKMVSMAQEYEKYRTQCRQMAKAQLELLEGNAYKIDFKAENINTDPLPSAETKETKEKEGISLFLQDAKKVKEQKVTEEVAAIGNDLKNEINAIFEEAKKSEEEAETAALAAAENEARFKEEVKAARDVKLAVEAKVEALAAEESLKSSADEVKTEEAEKPESEAKADTETKSDEVKADTETKSDTAETDSDINRGETLQDIFERLKNRTETEEMEKAKDGGATLDTTDVWSMDSEEKGSDGVTFYQKDNMQFTHVKKENKALNETTDFEFINDEDK